MTDQSNAPEGPTNAGTQPTPGQGPSVRILVQYLKDLSFESPRAPHSLQQRENPPTINVNVNVNATGFSETDFEVTLKLEAAAVDGSETLFNMEVEYAGIFRIQGIPREQLQPFLLIEGPRLLFPFARQIVADGVRSGGFPPLMLDPIDFVALYRSNVEHAQGAATAPSTSTTQ